MKNHRTPTILGSHIGQTPKAIRGLEEELFKEPLRAVIVKLTYRRRLARTWQLIEAEFDSPALTLERAGRESGLNKNHLNVLFRQTTSFTFHQFLVRYRLLRAITIMPRKNYSLLEIALQVGFGSLTTFERNFRKLIGISPKELSESGFMTNKTGFLTRRYSCAVILFTVE